MSQTEATIRRIARLVQHDYGGGYNGTCYECPYASEPLEMNGRVAEWRDIANDPTEAYYRCSLPTRTDEVAWGEYAPCTALEWAQAHLPDLDLSDLSPWQRDNPDSIIERAFLHLVEMLPALDSGSQTQECDGCFGSGSKANVPVHVECPDCGGTGVKNGSSQVGE